MNFTIRGICARILFECMRCACIETNDKKSSSDKINYSQIYVYYYLKYIQNSLFEMAKLTHQPSLTKPLLLSIQIPDISIDNKILVCNDCIMFNQNIQNLNRTME